MMNSIMIPISPSQNRILLAELEHPGTKAYHLYGRMSFSPEDTEFVKKAIPYVFSGNLNLRLTNTKERGYVLYSSDEAAQFEAVDVREIGEIQRMTVIPLFDSPLYRIYLYGNTNETVLFFSIHHIVADGTTVQTVIPNLLRQTVQDMKEKKEVTSQSITYDTYINRQKEYANSDPAGADKMYWIDKLTGYRGIGYKANRLDKSVVTLDMPSDVTEKLKQLCNTDRISPFVTGLGAAFLYFMESKRVLGSAAQDMVWEISVNGRYFGEDIAGDPGMYVATLPLRFSYNKSRSFLENLKYIKSVMKEGLKRAKTDTNEYLGELKKSGVDPRSLTAFSIVSNAKPADGADMFFPDETDVPFHIRVNPNKTDSEGLQCMVFEYNNSLFSEADIIQIKDGVAGLLRQAAEAPEKTPADYNLQESRLIRSECLIEKNITVTDEPVSLQCGMNRGSGESAPDGELTAVIRDKKLTDPTRLTAALMDALVRFGMTKEVLIGVKYGASIQPLGIRVDTGMRTSDFVSYIRDRFKEVETTGDYPMECRTDLDFRPSVVISFREAAPIADGVRISILASKEGTAIYYDSHMYAKEYMASLHKSIRSIYDEMASDKYLKEILLVPKKSEKHVVSLKNEGTVNAVFANLVCASPEKEILTATDGSMTYRELDDASNRLGNALIRRDIRHGDRVLLLMRRTSALIVSVFGVLKAGAVFITMDPDYPKERIDQIIEDSKASIVLTDIDEVENTMPSALSYADMMEEKDTTAPDIPVSPDDMCFIIYTSGTTGKPKGVVLSHRGITNYVAAEPENAPMYGLKEKCTRMLCLSSVSFIVFLREIFGTILNGVPVVLCNEEQAVDPTAIADLIDTYHIDALGSTPTRLLQYIEVPGFREMLRSVRLMIVGGEGFPGRLYEEIRKYSSCDIYNSYGPTEVTIASHQKRMESPRVSAGYTMLNVWDRIADPDGNELPPYAAGELYVGGAGVAVGYFGDEELTSKRFPVIDGERYCNTGDLAYKDENGEVFVLGRNDGMIKLRGLRIELEEIENTIGNYPGIAHARVVVRSIQGTEHLCAFFTLKKGTDGIQADVIRKYIGEKLPPYMVPSYYTCLKEFPLTPNGKVQVKVLKEMDIDVSGGAAFEEPETETEKKVWEILSKVTGTDRFGIREDLFTVGLTSLTMISAITGMYEEFGVSLRVTDFMQTRTVAGIAELVEKQNKKPNAHIEQTNPKADDVREFYPLTENQLGIYLDCVAHPDSIGYHLPNVIRFNISVDPNRLKNAIARTISHHIYLKTSLVSKGGEVMQRRDDNRSVDDAIILEKSDSYTDEKAEEYAAIPFDLNGGLLFRFKIIQTPDEIVMLSVFHHLIVDGGSLGIVFDDIAAAYDGRELSEESVDGYRISVNEKQMENSPAYAKGREYYANRFTIADEPTVLTPNKKEDASTGKLGVERVGVDAALVDAFCLKHGISQNVLFMSALYVVLTKYISDDKVLLATVSNGRLDPSAQNTVALLVRTLPLVLKEERDESVPELFTHVRDVWMETLANQIYPFTKLSGEFDIIPEFFYTYHGRIYEEICLGGRQYARGRVAYDSLRYSTMVNVILEDKYYIQTEYNDALYTADYICNFTQCIGSLIEKWSAMGDLSSVKIRELSLGNEDMAYDFHELPNSTIDKAFEEAAKKEPDKEILMCSGQCMTYDELNHRANRIANALRKRGLKEGGSVVLLIPRSCDLVAAILGILKAGAAYIPMDIDYPSDRIAYVARDAGADLIITSRDMAGRVTMEELLAETDETTPSVTTDMNRTCYMIYTSGSTGRPKGVEVAHKNIWNLCQSVPENMYYHAREDKPSSVLNTGTISFDISVLDILGSLVNGIKVILADDEENKNVPSLVKLMRETKPDAFGMITPSRMQQYLTVPEFADAITVCRMCSVGGEAFIPALFYKIREISDMDVYNLYGPTETTVICNTRLVKEENIMSVGKALYNVRCDIRDMDGKILPDGAIGELYIGGYGVSKGYHNMPEKTADSFITLNGVPYFKSGDFAYKLPDGEVVVMGRRDGQIKLRGLRIEIGEIEQSMEMFGSIEKAAVVVRKIGKTEHLCGYFSAKDEIDIDALRSFLETRLTPYMVPTVLMQLDEMPYTTSGKLDRKNLPDPVITKSYTAPATDEEEFFCHIFEQVLEIEDVGATDDFFSIGGSSLLATQLTILAANGGYEIKFKDVFDNPTPRKMAAFVTGSAPTSTLTGDEEQDIRNYDYSAIHEYLKNNNIRNYTSGEKHDIHHVLLTGATGFLGIHVLRELLATEDVNVYCMLRGKNGKSPSDRLRAQLFYYFDDDYSHLEGIRLFAREGAITNADDFDRFDDTKIDTIINCAASVKHFSAGTDIYDTNVEGVKNGLRYAKKRDVRYIHISTMSSAGEIPVGDGQEVFTFDEQVLYKGQILDNQYLSSKFLSERLVLQAAADGADAKVMRVGNLMARNSDGIFQINFKTNGFVSRLKAYATLKRMPYDKMLQKTEFSPIDITAKAILKLASSPKECCLFNCYNNHTVSFADILKAANVMGVPIKPAENEEFRRILDEAMQDEEKQKGLYGLITTVGMGTKKERVLTPVNNDYTILALCNDDVYWPILSENYLGSFIRFLRDMGFWD